MHKQANRAAKNALLMSKSYGRHGRKGYAKKVATRAHRRANKALCQI